ncbi:unnamed protein product [Tenebrio molitor]|nr:unnamed protein product [Tenebrio molitor]
MYYADTLTGIIDQFDFDVTNGAICNLKKHNIEGFPNGMAIDTDGNLKFYWKLLKCFRRSKSGRTVRHYWRHRI